MNCRIARRAFCIVAVVAVLASFTAARRPSAPNELYWSHLLATELHGEAEHRLDDGARIDILLPDAAVEIDWSKKWAEGIGQAAYYGASTGRRPVVLYLVADPVLEARYLKRGRIGAKAAGVTVWLYDISRRKWIEGPSMQRGFGSDVSRP